MMRDIQVLAQIKLNLTTLDQFLGIACGLADDNPSIKERVYGGAREARSTALLIDHLRNLFSHQQSIEAQQAAEQQFHQQQVQYHHQQQQQQQQQQQAPSGGSGSRPLLSYGSILHNNNNNNNNNNINNAYGGGGARYLFDRAQLRQNSQLFAHSNQLTLVRAAKCLVANVAKILYLTDSIVLRNEAAEQNSGNEHQLQLEKLTASVKQPALSDRLDNVANYSQLLRCFGELSTELVDLGHCIMFSEHHRLNGGNSTAPKQLIQESAPRDWSILQEQLGGSGNAEEPMCRRRNSHHHAEPMAFGCQDLIGQPNSTTGYYQQMRSSASTTSMLQASRMGTDGGGGTGPASAVPMNAGPNGKLVEVANDDGPRLGATVSDWLEAADNQLVTKIRDMQTLFQVNRLIIDRSILLLLSASKCCLRQGNECLRGLEARHSIVVQIRASVSIIMAIVKCSIFGGSSGQKEVLTGGGNSCGVLGNQQVGIKNWPNLSNLFSGPSSSGGHQTQAAIAAAAAVAPSNTNSVVNINSGQRDNQFDNYYYLACLSPFRSSHNNNATKGGCKGRAFEPIGGSLQPYCKQSADQQFSGQQPSAAMTGGQANKFHCGNLNLNSNNGMDGGQWQQIGAGGGSRSLEWPLQIMNYFLQTWNGTQSAHEAISKLQLLVRPFACLTHNKALIGTLNDTIDAFDRLQEAAKSKQKPSSRPNHHQQSLNEGPCEAAGRLQPPWPGSSASGANLGDDQDKENQFFLPDEDSTAINTTTGSNCGFSRVQQQQQQQSGGGTSFMLMNKRQLIAKLNSMFLGELKTNLIERAHEFTDCAYTKHEHRETIVLLIHCIKMQLSKLVKLLYRLRRRVGATSNELNISHLRQLATQLDDTCAELKFELQTIVIEQSDELDKCNSQLDLIKQLKHHCLMGDLGKSNRICLEFHEQSEQLIEVCKMLNQVSPTNKMKISTKTLAIWFELNINQLLGVAECLSQNPRSRVLKDCTWAYIQVWCSFYDDFCQLARQLAYLTHAQCDTERAHRVAALRDQMLERSSQLGRPSPNSAAYEARHGLHDDQIDNEDDDELDDMDGRGSITATGPQTAGATGAPSSSMAHAVSVQSLNMVDAFSDTTDSPRSLDHYYGFGANYSRGSRAAHQLQQQASEPHQLAAVSRQSASPRLCCPQQAPNSTQLMGYGGVHEHENLGDLANIYTHQHQEFMHPDQQQQGLRPFAKQQGLRPFANQQHHQTSMGPPLVRRSAASMEPAHPQAVPMMNNFLGPGPQMGGVSAPAYQLPPPPPPVHSHHGGGTGPRSHRQHHHHHHRHHHYQQQQQPAGRYFQEGQQHAMQMPTTGGSYHSKGVGEPSFQLMAPEAGQAAYKQHGAALAPGPLAPIVEPGGVGQAPIAVACGNQAAAGELCEGSTTAELDGEQLAGNNTDQQSSATEADKWSDSDADAIVRGARETAQMALSMYQFTKGEGDLNTTQDLFTQAELFAEEANELYKEVRCFSYKVPAGDLKKELLAQLGTIPALVQQLQFIVKNPTVGKPATFAKVDSVIRETRSLMEAVNRVVTATLSCRQHYNMAIASMRKRTRTLSPSYRGDKGLEFENHSSARQSAMGGRHGSGGGGMGSEPDI